MNINLLRELIKTGEYLETNIKDSTIRNKWIFDVEEYLDFEHKQRISTPLFHIKTINTKENELIQYLEQILGLLRSLYNKYDNNYIFKNEISNSQSVFIIHGHDNELIKEVKDCIKELNLNPVVLREQPNNGETIIEKLEDYLGNAKCAIVLYTPCDIGKAKEDKEYENRARQNVVYEHGLFQGGLGRKRIIVLRKGNTIIPGDLDGLVYISVEQSNWQEELKKNIESIDTLRKEN